MLEEDWRISFRRYDEKDFGSSKKAGKLYNITAAEETEDFSGTLRYETDLEWNPDTDGELLEIDFGTVYETLEVWLNDEEASVRIAPPYCCTLQNLRKGTNRLTVYVANTLVHKYRDSFSATMPIEGSGLLGACNGAGILEVKYPIFFTNKGIIVRYDSLICGILTHILQICPFRCQLRLTSPCSVNS